MKKQLLIAIIGLIVIFTSCSKSNDVTPAIPTVVISTNTYPLSNTLWKSNLDVYYQFKNTSGIWYDTIKTNTPYNIIVRFFDFTMTKDTLYLNYYKMINNNIETIYLHNEIYKYTITNDSLYYTYSNGTKSFIGRRQ